METYPVAIIGAGPAGLTAAMQLSRQGIKPLVFERNRIGGLLLNANLVENYPGFVEGITGSELVDLFRRQADRLGVEINQEEVLSVGFYNNLFRIVTDKREVEAEYLVAATGTKARTLSEEVFEGDLEGALFTDVYPIINETGKDIIVVGSGDAALDYALNLAGHNQVIILNRGNKIKALSLLWDRVQENRSIKYYPNKEIKRVIRDESGRILVTAGNGNDLDIFECDYLLTAIGRDPDLDFVRGEFSELIEGLLINMKVYFIGDLHNGSCRQTALAVGDGIRTAMQIGQKLEKGNL